MGVREAVSEVQERRAKRAPAMVKVFPFAEIETPPLEPGDRLTRHEFERRYNAMHHIKKAELIVEIAATSATYDLYDKLKVYRRNGVQEYVVWQVYDQRLDWFRLSEGQYVPLTPDEVNRGLLGVVRSQVFPGLHLDVPALLAGDLAGILDELHRGLETAEHSAFAEHLSALESRA